MPTRELDPGMGVAVAERTYLRPLPLANDWPNPFFLSPKSVGFQKWFQMMDNSGRQVIVDESGETFDREPVRDEDFRYETWDELAGRVARGNTLLHPSGEADYGPLWNAISDGHTVLAGRHLQQGDERQPTRPQTVFTNCSTAASAWSRFYLLLNGSGVGRSLDDDILLVDWDRAPSVQCVLSENHPDFKWGGEFLSRQEAQHRFGRGDRVHWHEVEDSREGWARALETWEMMAFQRRFSEDLLILDFTPVRGYGQPIRGMQGRPSSGPTPTMAAFHKAAAGLGSGVARWKQTMYVEHYFSESVLVGGARRASGLLEKYWKDPGIFDFIRSKVPVIYEGMTGEEIREHRLQYGKPMTTPLWTSNHSVGIDDEFWWLMSLKRGDDGYATPIARHARNVFRAVVETAYATGTGEPGLLNLSKLNVKQEGQE